jgi:hypothetical protein
MVHINEIAIFNARLNFDLEERRRHHTAIRLNSTVEQINDIS